MAEASALTSIAKSALQFFSSLAKDEFLLLWHSGDDIQKLKDTIETISCFLQDAQERESNDRAVHHCLLKLRKVMYDADDLFDALAFHLLRNKNQAGNRFTKEVRLFFSKSNQLGFIVRTAHKVKSLRESVDAIAKNMQQFSFIQHPLPPVDQSFTRKKTHSFVHQEDIIGRDEDKAHIISMLIPNDEGKTSCHQSISVVAVIGFGGLGKTALAQFVYNDETVKQGFEVHLWACINYLSNLEQVLKEILASKVEKNQLDLSVQMLQEKLRGIIGGKKFLLVLDDVWEENLEKWLDLETILRCGKSGSKVLVTTRSNKVAKCLHASEPYCDLRGLSEESAWSLFVRRAFQGEDPSEHPELEPIGKKIIQKCGNVPLAIVIVGSLLHQKGSDERTWTEFYDNELKEVLLSGDDRGIKQVLMTSYRDLHPNLKLCFAYCSLFPKDYEFDKDDLVRLWLAQGILKPSVDNERSVEEVGEAYFFHLVDRCFFQEVKYEHALSSDYIYVGNDMHKCTAKMHDLIHDMAIIIAKTENLFLDKVPKNKRVVDSVRHISIAFDLEDSFDSCNLVSDPKTVRTLLLYRCKEQLSQSTFSPLLETFTMIRTLDLAYMGVDEVPESIGRLIHLRYLELSENRRLKHLPDSICELHHLIFFLLKGCNLLEMLPQQIEKLVSLRQLHINGCHSLKSLPSGLKALSSLVNLDRLIVHPRDGGLGFLKGLDNLAGVLRIELPEEGWLDATEDAKKANMVRKNKLNEMVIQWKRRSASSSEQIMPKDEAKSVLEALRPHEKLEYLKIVNYGGEMLTNWFWTLKFIKQLCLEDCDQVEYLEDGIEGCLYLPSLKLLSIRSMRNLKGWWRHEIAQNYPHLPSVSAIDIWYCPKLKGQMPLFNGIEYLSLIGVNAEVVAGLLLPNCSPFYTNSKLMELELREVEGLISLQERWIKHLTALQSLAINDCRDLKWVSRRGLAHLTALKSLYLDCGEIGEEDEEDYKMGSEARMPWKALLGLGELTLGFGGRTFQLPKYGIQYLHSLRHLTLCDCPELYLSWNTLLVNTKLVKLLFKYVESVMDVEEDKMMVMEPQHIQLRSLSIEGWADAKWVDDIPWFSLSSSLTFLTLRKMDEREQLPDGIQHLTSLQSLDIWECEKLRALPVWIPKLTSLVSLGISGCSAELKRRYRKETGEDWPLICHLPRITIISRSVFFNLVSSR